jgi:citrate lyase subunit beta / citryl-CoA lyase
MPGIKLRRSVLYTPGSNERALAKARTFDVDGLIFDLEDAVAPDEKERARKNVRSAIEEGGYGHIELLVRINSLDTEWGHEDIREFASSSAAGIVIPKVESAEHVRQVLTVMNQAGVSHSMDIWCMMETPMGILKAEEIAASSTHLTGLIVGTSDLAKDLGCAHTPLRLPMLTSLSQCLLAARAFGLSILDGVYLNIEDCDGFKAACKQGRELGFDGKTLIHPNTIKEANDAFGPNQSELEWANRVIAARQSALAQGKGVTLLDGRLIENLHVVAAQRTLDMAREISKRS